MLESDPKEMNISSLERGGLSSYDRIDDRDEKEVSDEDDDDRNHKHRRRDTNSQSSELDAADQGLTRPYRKRNKLYENGYPFRENESQASETWKDFNAASFEKDVSGGFDKRRINSTSVPRISDFNNKYRANQIPPGDFGFVRGRGGNPSAWNQRDSRFSSADIASQIVHQGPIPPSLFAGRGLPNLANPQSTSWRAYGLMPGIPNGGLDMINSFGLLGTLGQPINSSLNIVVPRQRCRDFEERGFCLRGDMCPMEHGVNRIVVEDVQSLSQFNLPVSVPSAHLMGKSSLPGSLPATGTSSTTLTNSKERHSNSSKPRLTVADDSLTLNSTYSDFVTAGVADLYDPDQPLWNNRPESASLLELKAANIGEAETMLNDDPSDHHHIRISDSVGNELPGRSNVTTVVSQSENSAVWGRMGSSKNRLDVLEKTDPTVSSSDYVDNEKENTEVLGKRIRTEDSSKEMNMSLKTKNDIARNTRKPSQKALRTLFVSGIPEESNKTETLLSHFKKFGEVIDIYIPTNSKRAFVQFSKREEAEAALMAPDAVMGNRFIKLLWANRDSILDNGLPHGSISAPCGATHQTSIRYLANRGSETLQASTPKGKVIYSSDVAVSDPEHPKPLNGPKVPQKKLQSLELMKEELRKKQEMLDQKRNDFRRKLDKLEKQATGTKGEVVEKVAKRPKVDIAADASKGITPKPSDPDSVVALPHAEIVGKENTSVQKNDAVHAPKTSSSPELQECITQMPPVERENSLPPTPKGSSEPDVDEKSGHSNRNGVEKAMRISNKAPPDNRVAREASNAG